MTETPAHHGNTRIFPASLDPKAVDVVTRLTKAGFESYLVGGCVRDLLLGHIPKDFDVSTAARPRQIRRVFRNCRIIGRRFKLAHVHFGEQIIEVATFRRNPSDKDKPDDVEEGRPSGSDSAGEADGDDLLITRDNEFGTAEEDSKRRDFTINALLYDVTTNEVIDWVGGFEDIHDKVLRTIGEPAIRLAEDPVRMLRAVKFAARLDLTVEPSLDAAMRQCAELIEKSAPARVIEEIFKLLTCGRAEVSLRLLQEYGLLERLMPEVAGYWVEHPDRLVAYGRALDRVDHGRRRVSNALLLSVLFHDPWLELWEEQGGGDPLSVASDLVAPAALRTSIPRRDVARMKQLLITQLRLTKAKRSRRFRMNDFLGKPSTVEAIELLYLRALVGGIDPERHAEWAERLARKLGEDSRPPRGDRAAERAAEHDEEPPRRRRRRRRGGRRRARPDPAGPDGRPDDDDPEPAGEARSDGDGGSAASAGGPPPDPASQRNGDRDAGSGPPAELGADDHPPAPDDESAPDAPAGSDAPGNDDSREARPAREATPVKADAGRRGLGGLVKSLFRKVLSGEAAPDPEPPPTSRPTPARDDASDGGPDDERSAPTAGAEDDERPTTPDRSRADDRGPSRSGDGEPAGASGEAGDGATAPDRPAGDASDEADEDRPRRRRRRRRRRRKPAAEGSSDTADSVADSDDGGRADADSRGTDESAGSDSGARSGNRRRRRRRSGSGSRDGERSSGGGGGGGGEGGSGRKRSSRGGKGAGGSARKSGKTRSGKAGKPGRTDQPQPKRDDDNDEKLGQRHPEDVEDMFDW